MVIYGQISINRMNFVLEKRVARYRIRWLLEDRGVRCFESVKHGRSLVNVRGLVTLTHGPMRRSVCEVQLCFVTDELREVTIKYLLKLILLNGFTEGLKRHLLNLVRLDA